MSEFDHADPYQDSAAEERERASDWAENVEEWRRTCDDALTRDAGEKPGWPVHVERVRDRGYEDGDPKGQER